VAGIARLLRIVLDTNLFVSALIREGGVPYQVITAWRESRFQLVTTAELNAEIAGVLARNWLTERYSIDAERRAGILRDLDALDPVEPLTPLPMHSRDALDDKVLAAALGGDADFLVTGDNDLLSLDGDPRLGTLRIVTPAEFLRQLGSWERAGREPAS